MIVFGLCLMSDMEKIISERNIKLLNIISKFLKKYLNSYSSNIINL